MTTNHTSESSGISQCDSILSELHKANGEWVAMPHLASVSGSYNVHSRVSDLRKAGHNVEHRNERKGRMHHSFYRLKSNIEQLTLI